jgi:VIT1/CCC1 family predicted Fe2+/Mn2+ transporter
VNDDRQVIGLSLVVLAIVGGVFANGLPEDSTGRLIGLALAFVVFMVGVWFLAHDRPAPS